MRYIYFVQESPDGAIKIGWTGDPVARLRSLQCGNPRELVLLGWFAELKELTEQRIHSRLSDHQIIGEWFEPADEVFAVFDEYEEKRGRVICEECDRIDRYLAAGHPFPIAQAYSHVCGSRPNKVLAALRGLE